MAQFNATSNRPTVSVVVPFYNMEDWLEETLLSVVDQTWRADSLEVVLVDDGSTDRSAAIAEAALRRSAIEFRIIRTANGGPSRARNIGWRSARGEWVQFLDGDDLLHPGKIDLQLRQAPEREVAVLYSDWDRLEEYSEGWRGSPQIQSPTMASDPIADLLKSNNFIATGSQLFRRCWLQTVGGFDECCWLIEDVNLMLRIAMGGGGFEYVPSSEPQFHYRQRTGGSLSRSNEERFIEGCVRNARMVEDYWQSAGALTRDRAHVLSDVYFQAARYYAGRDRAQFDGMIKRIELLVPDFVPGGPQRLKYVSHLLGYRRAEILAVTYRRLRRVLRPSAAEQRVPRQ